MRGIDWDLVFYAYAHYPIQAMCVSHGFALTFSACCRFGSRFGIYSRARFYCPMSGRIFDEIEKAPDPRDVSRV